MAESTFFKGKVLILIVMDNGLSPLLAGCRTLGDAAVLILIVMDNGLSHVIAELRVPRDVS